MAHGQVTVTKITFTTIHHAVEIGGLRRVLIEPSGTGEQTVIPGIPGKRILILALHIIASAATDVIFKSNSTAISGVFGCPQEGTIDLANALIGVLITEIGEAFVIDQSVDGVDGFATYIEL